VSFLQGGKESYKVGIVTVDFDETISHYADWSGYTMPELYNFNKLPTGKKLQVDQKIKVPFNRKEPSHFESKRQEYHKAIQEDFFNNYRVSKIVVRNVKKGDTLWEICNDKHFIPFWLMSNYNPGKNMNSIHEGESIVIPVLTPVKAS
jgi:membrane-bound lytic murein transglycosylase D